MASSLSVTLKGARGFLNQVRLLRTSVSNATEQAVVETALAVESDAKRFAPVDTGRLRSAIHAVYGVKKYEATVEVPVTYAPAQEFGTRYMPAQPFLGPAYEMNRGTLIQKLRAAGLK